MLVRTLYARLALGLFLLLLIVGGLYTVIVFSASRHMQQEIDQRLSLDLARELVEERHLVVSGALDQAALKATFSAYMTINPSIEIYLLDQAGRILAYSADPNKVKRTRVDLAPIRAFLAGQRLPVLGDDPRSLGVRKIFSVTPVPSAKAPEGYLYVVLRGEKYDDIAGYIRDSLFWQQSVWALLGSLAVGLLAGLLLFYRMTRRLRRLSADMDRFRQCDFVAYQPLTNLPRGGDEIDELGRTFNDMAARIVDQLAELKRQDRLRRDLIANVSHDLRTPVAILNGYLETMVMKDTELSSAERHEYLRSALQSSERLTCLIADLFELARLDAPQESSRLEAFNIAELAQDVVQKFMLRASEQGLTLRLDLPEPDCQVCADIGQISRVFENLLANALAVTGSGQVVFRLTKVDGRVVISIEDSGPGIPRDERADIFDRFYQGSHGRGSPGGLGLAICSKIVALHGATLAVDSEEGIGSRFYFSLPLL